MSNVATRSPREFLIPADELRAAWTDVATKARRFELIARRFKTSQIVVARRALDVELIPRTALFELWELLHQAKEHMAALIVAFAAAWEARGNLIEAAEMTVGDRATP